MRWPNRTRIVVTLCGLALLVASASAEWSSNPAQNLAIANLSNDQVQPKIVATSDGGCYISWFDNHSGGYDVRLQRLNRYGDEQWAHNGILIADRSYGWTVDYDLGVDASGNAIITYNDDRSGGDQIGCNLVAPDGTFLWGNQGILLTNTTEFVPNPHCVFTSDGYYVFGWSQENDFVLQKLDATGLRLWGPNGIRIVAATDAFWLSELKPSDNGAVIALFIRPIGSFLGDKHLYTQKFSATGSLLWGAAHVLVYESGSIQNGYFPTFVSDGAGGAVFGWYEVSGVRNVYIQHVNAAGLEVFPHNGVAASTLGGNHLRLDPSVCYNAGTGETFLFWTETNYDQTVYGLYGQKFSQFGVRQWTDNAHMYVALGAPQIWNVTAITSPPGAMVFWFPSSGATVLKGMRVNGSGTPVWSPTMINVSSVNAGKGDIVVTQTNSGSALVAWMDERADSGDIYAQNVTVNGTLGVPAVCHGDSDCDGQIAFSDIDLFAAAIPDNEAAWSALYAARHAGLFPQCRFLNNDCTNDGHVNFADIDPFVALIPSTCP